VTLPPGPIIGVFDDVTWESAPLPDRREGVLFYTDGLVEGFAAPGQTERWGTERLLVAIARERARTRELEGLPQRLIRDATEANGDELSDDVAILILR
jgi:serine phosphatase RsbU (regulator of sigma subunit)